MENNQTNIKALVKQCLGIINSSTAKDAEIDMLIDSAKADMKRVEIEFDNSNPLHKTCVVQYVKGHFSMLDNDIKELCLKSYTLLITDLQLSL